MRVCRMGYGCTVRARVNDDASDVDIVIRVLDVTGERR